jgi:hypothetical protein
MKTAGLTYCHENCKSHISNNIFEKFRKKRKFSVPRIDLLYEYHPTGQKTLGCP